VNRLVATASFPSDVSRERVKDPSYLPVLPAKGAKLLRVSDVKE